MLMVTFCFVFTALGDNGVAAGMYGVSSFKREKEKKVERKGIWLVGRLVCKVLGERGKSWSP